MDSAKQGETAAVQDTSASSGLAGAGAQTATAGSAAVGSTSTYSSHHLGTGDPNPSVVDRSSNDPTTYQTPEKNLDTGVPAGSATMAATAAFAGRKEGTSRVTHTISASKAKLSRRIDARSLPIIWR